MYSQHKEKEYLQRNLKQVYSEMNSILFNGL